MNYGAGIHVDADGYIDARSLGSMARDNRKPSKTRKPALRDRCAACNAVLSTYNLTDDTCAPCSGERWAEH